ncbi:MAG: glycosyl hydrolase family 28-related protein [Planctomycetota bacterium]
MTCTSTRPSADDRSSLALPVDELPTYDASLLDPATWANVDDFGAKGDGKTDDTEAFQAAIDSGAPVLFLPSRLYRVMGPLRVPATLKSVEGHFGELVAGRPVFVITEASNEPFWVRDLKATNVSPLIAHAAERPIVLDRVTSTALVYQNHMTADDLNGRRQKLHVVNTTGFGKERFPLEHVDIWARFINTEFKGGPNFTARDGCRLWVLGYKVEGAVCNFAVESGGAVEVLGGVANQFAGGSGDRTPAILEVRGGSTSYVGCTNGSGRRYFDDLVALDIGERSARLSHQLFPERVGRDNNWFIPLFVHREGDDWSEADNR